MRPEPTSIGSFEQAGATALAMLSLSKTERRIAHRYRLAASEAERKGNRTRYQYYTLEYRKHWRRALFYLDHARLWFSKPA